MISKKVILKETHGLHARPALRIVQACREFKSQITICNGCEKADGCSIMELMLLAAKQGSELEIVACGTDEETAVIRLQELFEHGSGI